MYTVHIKPQGYNLIANPGETVLAAAERQGYHFPNDCQNGVCGTCKGKLLEGHVEYDEDFLPALSEAERDSGYALFCSAKPTSNLVIYVEGVIGPEQLPIKQLPYNVQSVDQLTPTIYQVILQPATQDYIRYRAGQYIEVLHRDASPQLFSIANAPLGDEHLLEIQIRARAENSAVHDLLNEMRSAKKILIKGPEGNCLLKREPAYPYIFAAGGTGIAPIKALIEQALADGIKQPIYLYWGVRILSDFYLQDLINRWAKYIPNFHYIPIISGKDELHKWQGRTGWVHEAIVKDHPNLEHFHIYASGPVEMVYAALHAFKSHGLNRALMYSDILDYAGEI